MRSGTSSLIFNVACFVPCITSRSSALCLSASTRYYSRLCAFCIDVYNLRSKIFRLFVFQLLFLMYTLLICHLSLLYFCIFMAFSLRTRRIFVIFFYVVPEGFLLRSRIKFTYTRQRLNNEAGLIWKKIIAIMINIILFHLKCVISFRTIQLFLFILFRLFYLI